MSHDEHIQGEICGILIRHPHLDASGVAVEVEGGEVALIGTVEDQDARWLAGDLAPRHVRRQRVDPLRARQGGGSDQAGDEGEQEKEPAAA
jgi:hypothetical protein